MIRMIPIETERLIINHGEIEDYVKVHEFDFNYLEDIDGNFKYVKRDPEEVRSWFSNDLNMEEHFKRLEKNKSYNFIIYLKDTLEPIGNIGFDRYNETFNSLEISCYIHPNYWRNDYVKEALISAMEYIYSFGFENIIYGYYEGNIKSKRNCVKLGFKPYEQVKVNNFLGKNSIEYRNIMSKEDFYKLYKRKIK